jgi:hypothetical protein
VEGLVTETGGGEGVDTEGPPAFPAGLRGVGGEEGFTSSLLTPRGGGGVVEFVTG